MENMTQKQIEQYNDVVDYINFWLIFNPSANHERILNAGMYYLEGKNYDEEFIRDQLLKALNTMDEEE